MAGGSLPGFRDFYPDEFAHRAHIFRAWREVARRYAFVEYDGPPLEPLDLYTRKSGEEIVGQLYNFTDKGDRQVALRPEMTPTFARMVGARANALRKPVRWFSIPQLFRYERAQRGRLREHFQLNVDIVGEASEVADAELLAFAIDVMRELGLTHDDVNVRLSDRRLLASELTNYYRVDPGSLFKVFGVIDKVERRPVDVSLTELRQIGLTSSASEALVSFVTQPILRPTIDLFKSDEGRKELSRIVRLATNVSSLIGEPAADWINFDFSIVRGLAYYTGMVFELFDARGEFRAICGGGRYDNLLKDLSAVDLPALGFGMGDVVLGELLKERGKLADVNATGADAYIIGGPGSATTGYDGALRLASSLRATGLAVEHALSETRYQSPPRNQFDAAKKAGAKVAIYFDEGGKVTAKGLAEKHSEAPAHSEDAAAVLAGGDARERMRAFIAGLRPPPAGLSSENA